MKRKVCEMCGKPATRITVIYTLPNKYISIWQRFKRKHFMNATARKTPVCDECFFECHYGIYTIKCSKCNKEFKIRGKYFYDINKLYCPFCKELIK